jgi:hypothetical protein
MAPSVFDTDASSTTSGRAGKFVFYRVTILSRVNCAGALDMRKASRIIEVSNA